MKQSKLFGKTSREAPAEEVSVNAKLLTRAAYVQKLMAGVYSYLPLGLRVIRKIETIIREEIDAIGGQELLMPARHPKDVWVKTGRWTDPGREVMLQFTGRGDREYGLGWTHEEIVTPLAKKFIQSYKDLPLALYQIQSKFRDEPRAKSGLLRGREFSMKDLYSFHTDEKDLDLFYKKALKAYQSIFTRVGLDALVVEASGGVFSKYSHEFQVRTPAGEDIIMACEKGDWAQNREIAKIEVGEKCPNCNGKIRADRAIEVGNIFQLKTRFSQAFNLTYKDASGTDHLVVMGCYGIGIGRVMGSIVEVHHDERGIRWPQAVAPFMAHVVPLQNQPQIQKAGDALYAALQKAGIEVLYDDRTDASTGEKLAAADLIGIPFRIVISEKTLAHDAGEIKHRDKEETQIIPLKNILKHLKDLIA